MTRKVSIGVLAAALLMSGALVGVSFGGGGGITQPEVIELSLELCGDSCRGFLLRDNAFGRGRGLITLSSDPLFDVDGERVGHQDESCATSSGPGGDVGWVCTYVVSLKDGQHTDRGTVTTTGIYRFEGISRFAVTGGTGAYENVRGYATMEVVDKHEVLTLNLTP